MSTSTSQPGRAAKPHYHHGDLRNALLDAGAEVAHDVGSEALSLREVARRAGVSHTAAYNHFADKNDLLRGLAVRAFDELASQLRSAAAADGSLDDFGATYMRFAFTHAAEFRFMFQRSLCMPDGVYDPLEVAGKAAQQVLHDQVVRLQKSGALASGDPDGIVLAIWSQVHGITTIVLETPLFKSSSIEVADHVVREGVRALIAGIASSRTPR